MKYRIDFTNQFRKDLKLSGKQGKDLDKLWEVVEKLSNDEELPAKHKDHALTGNYGNYRECHIQPDWLLVYQKQDGMLILLLYRLGSHSDLF